jgi:hypothetical protein
MTPTGEATADELPVGVPGEGVAPAEGAAADPTDALDADSLVEAAAVGVGWVGSAEVDEDAVGAGLAFGAWLPQAATRTPTRRTTTSGRARTSTSHASSHASNRLGLRRR